MHIKTTEVHPGTSVLIMQNLRLAKRQLSEMHLIFIQTHQKCRF